MGTARPQALGAVTRGVHAKQARTRAGENHSVGCDRQRGCAGQRAGSDRVGMVTARGDAQQTAGRGCPQRAVRRADQRRNVVGLARAVEPEHLAAAVVVDVEQLDARGRAEPQSALRIESQSLDRAAPFAIGRAGSRARRRKHLAAGRVEAGDVCGRATEPEAVLAVLRDRRDEVVREAVGVVGVVLVELVAIAVVRVQPALGGDPHEAVAILEERGDGVLGQALIVAARIDKEPSLLSRCANEHAQQQPGGQKAQRFHRPAQECAHRGRHAARLPGALVRTVQRAPSRKGHAGPWVAARRIPQCREMADRLPDAALPRRAGTMTAIGHGAIRVTATLPITHAQLGQLLANLRFGIDPSDLHGSLTGYLCAGGRADARGWLAALELQPDDAAAAAKADTAVLQQLFGECAAWLSDPDLRFEPLLPAAETPVDVRADALVEWCRGFLGGVGLAGANATHGLSPDCAEILRDFSTIAGSRFEYADSEEDESALAEVIEFIRVGVLLLHSELAPDAPRARATLH